MPEGLHFFDRLGHLLKRFPAPKPTGRSSGSWRRSASARARGRLQTGRLSADTKQGMIDAVAAGPGVIQTEVTVRYLTEAPEHNGWLVLPTGRYGTDYAHRALVTQVGLGALTPSEAIYPVAQTDGTLAPLGRLRTITSSTSTRAAPPVDAFWSLTLYDSSGFFVPNAIDRWALNDRSDLAFNPDGSLDLYVQRAPPSDPAKAKNWLPSPGGAAFRLTMRL